jgi:hypothetical protein
VSTCLMKAATAVRFEELGARSVAAAPAPVTLETTTTELLDAIVAADSMIASLSGYRAQLIDQARAWGELVADVAGSPRTGGWDAAATAHRELVSELACALRLPERTAQTLVAHSQLLVGSLPATLTALQSGEISYRHAQSLADHAVSLPESTRSAFEATVLPAARELTVSRFDRVARTQRERAHPESIEARHVAGVADRCLSVTADRDGMAWLNVYLPAAHAIAIDDRLGRIAAGLRAAAQADAARSGAAARGDSANAADEPSRVRTLTQLKVDVLTDLLIDGEIVAGDGRGGIGRGIRASVHVTVPVLALLGAPGGAAPGTLEGYGPIDPLTAAHLAATAPGFTRLLTHPETQAVLSVGRDRYSPPPELRRWLRVRDETCRFPGCARRSSECEIDHTDDWQNRGLTSHDNLAHLCPSHHHLKHNTRWAVHPVEHGILRWTSPSGRTYVTKPALTL